MIHCCDLNELSAQNKFWLNMIYFCWLKTMLLCWVTPPVKISHKKGQSRAVFPRVVEDF